MPAHASSHGALLIPGVHHTGMLTDAALMAPGDDSPYEHTPTCPAAPRLMRELRSGWRFARARGVGVVQGRSHLVSSPLRPGMACGEWGRHSPLYLSRLSLAGASCLVALASSPVAASPRSGCAPLQTRTSTVVWYPQDGFPCELQLHVQPCSSRSSAPQGAGSLVCPMRQIERYLYLFDSQPGHPDARGLGVETGIVPGDRG